MPTGQAAPGRPDAPNEPALPNEPDALVINYLLREKASAPAKVTVTDTAGKTLATFDGPAEAGFNRALWNMRPSPPAGLDENAARRFRVAGKGQLAAGSDADCTLVKLDETLVRDIIYSPQQRENVRMQIGKLHDRGLLVVAPQVEDMDVLPVLWQMFGTDPVLNRYLLPAYFADEAPTSWRSYVRKPLWGREGANVAIVADGELVEELPGRYGTEGFVVQEFAPLLEPGDMIIDGGNAHFADTRRRERDRPDVPLEVHVRVVAPLGRGQASQRRHRPLAQARYRRHRQPACGGGWFHPIAHRCRGPGRAADQ